MSPQDRWNVVNYVYAMRGETMSLPAAQADASAAPGAPAARSVLALLDSALEFAKRGKSAEAGDRAFDAYIAFEPLETPARARQPGLVASMERHFADFQIGRQIHAVLAGQAARARIPKASLSRTCRQHRMPVGPSGRGSRGWPGSARAARASAGSRSGSGRSRWSLRPGLSPRFSNY